MPVRLDKWLWAARFYKTRSLAAEQIDAGRVEVNGERAKRSRHITIGDKLRIRKPPFEQLIEEMLIVHEDRTEIISNFPVGQITVVDPMPGYGNHVR